MLEEKQRKRAQNEVASKYLILLFLENHTESGRNIRHMINVLSIAASRGG
jgi:hypothetical protein